MAVLAYIPTNHQAADRQRPPRLEMKFHIGKSTIAESLRPRACVARSQAKYSCEAQGKLSRLGEV